VPPRVHTCRQSAVINAERATCDIRASEPIVSHPFWGLNDCQPLIFKIEKNTPHTPLQLPRKICLCPPPPTRPPPGAPLGLALVFLFYYIFNSKAGARHPGWPGGGTTPVQAHARTARCAAWHACWPVPPPGASVSVPSTDRKFDAGRRKSLNCWLADSFAVC
jgi:hypothetical protein